VPTDDPRLEDPRLEDPRLEQALHAAAPDVQTFGVVAQVTHRRSRRTRNRRITTGVLAFIALLAVGTITVLVTRNDNSSPYIASPGAKVQARVIDGDGAVGDDAGALSAPTPVTLDQDAHLLRAPVLVGATAFSVASYDAGPDAHSHVVRVDGTHVRDIVDLKARVLSIAEGEGARWTLTQNVRVSPGARVPDTFLKRIDAAGTPTSKLLPLDADPVGPIAAVGGAVWIPVRDGVLQYDPNGQFVRKVALPDASNRWVAQVGKLAYATDGNKLRSLSVSGVDIGTIGYGTDVLGLAAAGLDAHVLLTATDGSAEQARVLRPASSTPAHVTATLPDGFVPNGLAASTSRVWATGTVDGAPAIVLLDDRGVRATVVLENAGDGAALAWTDAHTVRAVAGGNLYEIAVD
jgi:hypothetical protein